MNILQILPSAISFGTILLLGCLGEIIQEKSGHLNLGLPGVMCFGTVGGCLGVSLVMSLYKDAPKEANYLLLLAASIILSIIFSCISGLIYALLTVTLKCNQNITGLALTTFGAGFADYFMNTIDTTYFSQASKILRTNLNLPSNNFTNIFLNHSIFIYLAIIIAILTSYIINKTRVGLSLRAVGENPSTSDAVGINITKYKYFAILIGCSIAGLAGLFYVMDFVKGSFDNSSTIQSFGWLSLALVIFTIWRPKLAILGSYLFGFLFIFHSYLNISFTLIQVFKIIPYIVTIIVLIITSIFGKKSVQPPESLGVSYFREDR